MGKFEHEVLELPPQALVRLIAYYRVRAQREKREADRIKNMRR